MRDVIQKVLLAETEAQRLLVEARLEAERIEAQARQEAEVIDARIQGEGRVEAERILEEAIRGGELEKQERLERATLEIRDQVRLPAALKQRAVEQVVRCVCGWQEAAATSPGDVGGGNSATQSFPCAGPEAGPLLKQ